MTEALLAGVLPRDNSSTWWEEEEEEGGEAEQKNTDFHHKM